MHEAQEWLSEACLGEVTHLQILSRFGKSYTVAHPQRRSVLIELGVLKA